ncbi:hypothetical protein AmFV_140 [Apis mellifera filamentous virus]|nr:hypothetical protein AmFV_140 [Apis mellifera filamentous virus]
MTLVGRGGTKTGGSGSSGSGSSGGNGGGGATAKDEDEVLVIESTSRFAFPLGLQAIEIPSERWPRSINELETSADRDRESNSRVVYNCFGSEPSDYEMAFVRQWVAALLDSETRSPAVRAIGEYASQSTLGAIELFYERNSEIDPEICGACVSTILSLGALRVRVDLRERTTKFAEFSQNLRVLILDMKQCEQLLRIGIRSLASTETQVDPDDAFDEEVAWREAIAFSVENNLKRFIAFTSALLARKWSAIRKAHKLARRRQEFELLTAERKDIESTIANEIYRRVNEHLTAERATVARLNRQIFTMRRLLTNTRKTLTQVYTHLYAEWNASNSGVRRLKEMLRNYQINAPEVVNNVILRDEYTTELMKSYEILRNCNTLILKLTDDTYDLTYESLLPRADRSTLHTKIQTTIAPPADRGLEEFIGDIEEAADLLHERDQYTETKEQPDRTNRTERPVGGTTTNPNDNNANDNNGGIEATNNSGQEPQVEPSNNDNDGKIDLGDLVGGDTNTAAPEATMTNTANARTAARPTSVSTLGRSRVPPPRTHTNSRGTSFPSAATNPFEQNPYDSTSALKELQLAIRSTRRHYANRQWDKSPLDLRRLAVAFFRVMDTRVRAYTYYNRDTLLGEPVPTDAAGREIDPQSGDAFDSYSNAYSESEAAETARGGFTFASVSQAFDSEPDQLVLIRMRKLEKNAQSANDTTSERVRSLGDNILALRDTQDAFDLSFFTQLIEFRLNKMLRYRFPTDRANSDRTLELMYDERIFEELERATRENFSQLSDEWDSLVTNIKTAERNSTRTTGLRADRNIAARIENWHYRPVDPFKITILNARLTQVDDIKEVSTLRKTVAKYAYLLSWMLELRVFTREPSPSEHAPKQVAQRAKQRAQKRLAEDELFEERVKRGRYESESEDEDGTAFLEEMRKRKHTRDDESDEYGDRKRRRVDQNGEQPEGNTALDDWYNAGYQNEQNNYDLMDVDNMGDMMDDDPANQYNQYTATMDDDDPANRYNQYTATMDDDDPANRYNQYTATMDDDPANQYNQYTDEFGQPTQYGPIGGADDDEYIEDWETLREPREPRKRKHDDEWFEDGPDETKYNSGANLKPMRTKRKVKNLGNKNVREDYEIADDEDDYLRILQGDEGDDEQRDPDGAELKRLQRIAELSPSLLNVRMLNDIMDNERRKQNSLFESIENNMRHIEALLGKSVSTDDMQMIDVPSEIPTPDYDLNDSRPITSGNGAAISREPLYEQPSYEQSYRQPYRPPPYNRPSSDSRGGRPTRPNRPTRPTRGPMSRPDMNLSTQPSNQTPPRAGRKRPAAEPLDRELFNEDNRRWNDGNGGPRSNPRNTRNNRPNVGSTEPTRPSTQLPRAPPTGTEEMVDESRYDNDNEIADQLDDRPVYRRPYIPPPTTGTNAPELDEDVEMVGQDGGPNIHATRAPPSSTTRLPTRNR